MTMSSAHPRRVACSWSSNATCCQLQGPRGPYKNFFYMCNGYNTSHEIHKTWHTLWLMTGGTFEQGAPPSAAARRPPPRTTTATAQRAEHTAGTPSDARTGANNPRRDWPRPRRAWAGSPFRRNGAINCHRRVHAGRRRARRPTPRAHPPHPSEVRPAPRARVRVDPLHGLDGRPAPSRSPYGEDFRQPLRYHHRHGPRGPRRAGRAGRRRPGRGGNLSTLRGARHVGWGRAPPSPRGIWGLDRV